ncbi:hypothetical protein [Microbacterium sp. No. 7]|uniref:hypothetical protein n=1 Tax=Microbacterium sp. No. 7 TaxID=1714373 RepID=UPI0006D2B8F9|nr:hypothetical protein [Microbacterium sp. No. 7]ALJ19557.1 hypothetical protein AOA12_06390 [Microbacterium sp. No. 7]
MTAVEHGTIQGARQGCRGRASCPASPSCSDVSLRYAGDWSFRRRIDQGMSVAEALAEQAAQAARPAPRPVRRATTGDRIHVDHGEVRRLHAAGMNDRMIGEQMGVSRNVVRKARLLLGLPPAVDSRTGKLTRRYEGRREAIVELRGQGLSPSAIAEALGLKSVSYVRRVCRESADVLSTKLTASQVIEEE